MPLEDAPACLVCGDTLGGRPVVTCADCETPHHADCWSYAGRCAVFACGGRTIDIFGSTRFAAVRGGRISILRGNGQVVREIEVESPYVGQPRWSPRGDALAFVGTVIKPKAVYADLDGALKGLAVDGYPSLAAQCWNPRGSKIAFALKCRDAWSRRIALWEPATNHVWCVWTPRPVAGAPAWSPRDDWIAVPCDGGVFLCGAHSRWVPDGADHDALQWSSDGSWLTSSDRGFVRCLQLSTGRRRDFSGARPAWSPSGRELAFWADTDMRVYRPDVDSYREIATGAPADLAWSPDGRHLAVRQRSLLIIIEPLHGTPLSHLSAAEFSEVAWGGR